VSSVEAGISGMFLSSEHPIRIKRKKRRKK
jgi:hypothetical protein